MRDEKENSSECVRECSMWFTFTEKLETHTHTNWILALLISVKNPFNFRSVATFCSEHTHTHTQSKPIESAFSE